MVCIREFHDKQHIYLSVTDKEIDDPRHGTRLTVYRSLRHAEGIQPSICEQNFLSEMSRKVEQENASATYVLKNTFQERPATSDLLPMLGRSIISDSVSIPLSCKATRIKEMSFRATMGKVLRRRNSNSAPKNTHNPDGVLKDRPTTWIRGESALFDSLGVFGENRRQTTYVAAFLSCWLCAFVLPENDERLIRPSTFEIATLMAQGQTFSLAIPVLASIYRGLNIISRSPKPAYSGASFPTHYVYGWLAHYFNTNYVVDLPPAGPLMVIFSGAQGAKCFNGLEARALIHEGSRGEVGCTILNKNRIELLFDDETLKLAHFDYLVSLQTGFLPLRFRDSFHIEPYTPYRFNRQFGFRQDVPSMLSRSVCNRTVTYYEALRYWTLWLFKGSRSRVYATCWSKVSISDLRDRVVVLCSSIESDPSRTKRKSPNDARDVAQPHRIDSNPEPITKNQSLHIPSGKDDISTKVNKVFDNDKSTSDAESDVNFKHQRGRRSKKPRVAGSEGDETDFGNAFDNIPIPSDIPTDLTKVGDIDFEMGVSFNVDDAMIEEATEPLNVLTDRTIPGKGKDIHIEKDLVERSNLASPAQS
ncbi:GATA transcription factor 14 [Bienertia sinuspersici]